MKTQQKSVGILGVGSYLPDEVRTNDWWPRSTLDAWAKKDIVAGKQPPLENLEAGEKIVVREMAALKNDTFRGSVERRVLAKSMRPSDAETEAARRAIAHAGIAISDIDFVLSSSFCPDSINVPNSFAVNRNLGIKQRCYTSGLDAGCNAFPLQLELAQQMIAGGRARYGLLTQSSILSRLLPYNEPFSTYFGDGAASMVVGPVPDGYGILGSSHFSNGGDCGALVAGVPGKEWYEEGRSYWYQNEKKTVFRMLLTVADIGKQAVDAALEDAGVSPERIDFFACHQGTPWMRKVVQEHAGLTRARALDTFPLTASLVGANIGLVMDSAMREGTLKKGDLTAVFASGVGTTWSSVILRWSG